MQCSTTKGYAPISVRNALVPFANWGSRLIMGFNYYRYYLLWTGNRSAQMINDLGICAFSLAVLFQIVTLPVEFNASTQSHAEFWNPQVFLEHQELKCTQKGTRGSSFNIRCGSSIIDFTVIKINPIVWRTR